MIPFPSFEPDKGPFDTSASESITNVVPVANGYGPFPQLGVVSSALAAVPRGAFATVDADGGVHIFVGTSNKLWKYNTVTLAFDDVTRVAGGNYTLGAEETWSFDLFGNQVLAAQKGDAVQTFTLGSSSNFAALGGSPPNSRVVKVIADHVALGEAASQSRKLTWSGINQSAFWTARSQGSDFQVFPKGGDIIAIAGYEQGAIIFQRNSIREMMRNTVNPTDLWMFREVEERPGNIAPRSVISIGSMIFYASKDGFYRFGSPSVPIGANRVDAFFNEDANSDYHFSIEGAADPINHRVVWRYRSQSLTSADTSLTDRLLVYDYSLDRWSLVNINLTGIFTAATIGYTLDTLDNLYASIEDIPFSLDSPIWAGGVPLLAGFSSDYKLGFFSGSAMEATLQTNDTQLFPMNESNPEGRRAHVKGFRPVSDVDTIYGRVRAKDRHGTATTTWTAETTASATTGMLHARSPGLLHRFEARIPAGSQWSYIHGIVPEAMPEGTR